MAKPTKQQLDQVKKKMAREQAVAKLDVSLWEIVYAREQDPVYPWRLLYWVGEHHVAEDDTTDMIRHRRAAAEMMRYIVNSQDPAWLPLKPPIPPQTPGAIDAFIYYCQWLVAQGFIAEEGFNDQVVKHWLEETIAGAGGDLMKVIAEH